MKMQKDSPARLSVVGPVDTHGDVELGIPRGHHGGHGPMKELGRREETLALLPKPAIFLNADLGVVPVWSGAGGGFESSIELFGLLRDIFLSEPGGVEGDVAGERH